MGLFNRKKKDDANPYADGAPAPFANPMTPYQQVRNNVAQGQPAMGLPGKNPRMNSMGSNASSTPPPSYRSPSMASAPGGGYGDEKYGAQSGYGSNRYDNAPAPKSGGGYGGFDADAGKSDLFGNASSRYAPPAPNAAGAAEPAAPGPSGSRYGNDPNKNALLGNAQDRYNPYAGRPQQQAGADDDEFGGYGASRELTEEEKEEQELQNTKDEIRYVKQESAATLDRALAKADEAFERAMATRANLASQEERLVNTERNLDTAAVHSRDAESKTKDLKRLNGSMFRPVAGNPFTKNKRQNAADEAALDRHRMERGIREDTRSQGFAAQQRMESTFKAYDEQPKGLTGNRAADRSKFTFKDDGDEDDSEDERLEDHIDAGLAKMSLRSNQLKMVAQDMGDDIERQNKTLDRLQEKSDLVDDHVRMNRQKLSRIR